MKAKTISAILRKKVNDWLASITDESVRALAAENTIVTGGSIASMLLNEPVNDYDIYFRNRETALAVANYYVGIFKPMNRGGVEVDIAVAADLDRIRVVIRSAGIASEDGSSPYEYFESRPEGEAGQYVGEIMDNAGDAQDVHDETEQASLETSSDGKPAYRPVFMSTNAITLSDRVQLVLRFFGEPDEIHKNYDFIHCTNYWCSWDGHLVLHSAALESLLSKELVYVGSKYPVCSIIRLRKFIKRGWTINAGQILKAVLQVSELDLRDIRVLQDQLTGVDCAYFCEVIAKLKEKDPQKVNAAYLVGIIDRMF